MHDERLTSLRAELARLTEQSTTLGPEVAEALTLQVVLTVVTALPDIVAAVSPDGRFLFVNRVVEGLTLEDVIGTSVYAFMPPESAARAREAIERVVRTGQPEDFDGIGPGAHGPESHYRNRCLPITSGDRVIAVALVVTDVTVEAGKEARLRDSEARLQLALSATGAGLWTLDLGSEAHHLDDRALAILGLEATPDARGIALSEVVHSGDEKRLASAIRDCVGRGQPLDLEHRVRRPDGSVCWVATEGVVLHDERGVPRQLVGTLRDVTERRMLEEQLRQAQKLEAVGQLTAGIAHNFNNLLAIILPNLELAAGSVPPEARTFLGQAETATLRAAELVRQLMTFAGKNRSVVTRAVDPGEVVRSAVAISRATFDRGIQVTVSIPAPLPPCELDPMELEQALLNVLINARDAVEDSGRTHKRIQVMTEVQAPDASTAEADRVWVVIRVIDNGHGMSEQVQGRAMEPFFTTKEVGKGTGLGLAMTYAMVRAAGGRIEIVSESGTGTSVAIYLPSADPTVAPDDSPAERPTELPSGTPHVLAVDDEPGVRNLIKAMLERSGFSVTTVGDGTEAMAALERETPDVMILDLSMPGPPWASILRRARTRCPDMKVLIYTGLAVEADDSGADAVLQKPASGAALVAAVRSVLSGPTEPR